jgi:hypothetical protein
MNLQEASGVSLQAAVQALSLSGGDQNQAFEFLLKSDSVSTVTDSPDANTVPAVRVQSPLQRSLPTFHSQLLQACRRWRRCPPVARGWRRTGETDPSCWP